MEIGKRIKHNGNECIVTSIDHARKLATVLDTFTGAEIQIEVKTYFFTFKHSDGTAQFSGPDKESLKQDRKWLISKGYKCSRVIPAP